MRERLGLGALGPCLCRSTGAGGVIGIGALVPPLARVSPATVKHAACSPAVLAVKANWPLAWPRFSCRSPPVGSVTWFERLMVGARGGGGGSLRGRRERGGGATEQNRQQRNNAATHPHVRKHGLCRGLAVHDRVVADHQRACVDLLVDALGLRRHFKVECLGPPRESRCCCRRQQHRGRGRERHRPRRATTTRRTWGGVERRRRRSHVSSAIAFAAVLPLVCPAKADVLTVSLVGSGGVPKGGVTGQKVKRGAEELR